MASYLMLAHLGSASCFSSFSQWRNAFRRHSNMNSGSLFLVEIRRMMSSFRPFGAASDSTSVTKPHLYSPSTRVSMILVSVLMLSPLGVSTRPMQRASCSCKAEIILNLTNISCFTYKKKSQLNLNRHAKCLSQRQLDQRFLVQELGDRNAVHHPHNVLFDALPDRPQSAVPMMNARPAVARMAAANVLCRPQATERPLHIAETDFFRGSRQNIAPLDPSMALGEASPLQGPEKLLDIGIGEAFAPRNLTAGKRLSGGHGSQLQDAANTVFFLGCNLHQSAYSDSAITILFCQVLERTTDRVGTDHQTGLAVYCRRHRVCEPSKVRNADPFTPEKLIATFCCFAVSAVRISE